MDGGLGGEVDDNSLTADDLGPSSVLSSELANGSVVGGMGGDVDDDTLNGNDIAPDAISASELNTSAVVGGLGGDVQDGTIGADDITNKSAAVSVPLTSFIECTTDAGTFLGLGEQADALPDLINSPTNGQGFTIRFDDGDVAGEGASDFGTDICSQVSVPPDFASFNDFGIRVFKDATGGAPESLTCAVVVNNGGLASAG